MTIFNTIAVGLKEIWAHKFRSLLTMLGIILGVASLVGMAAIIKGMENGMKETMIAMGGADKVLLEQQDVPVEQEHLADQAPGKTMTDVESLRRSAPLLRLISPEMAVNNVVLSRGDKMCVPSECVGVWPAVLDMNLHTLEHGRFFTDLDEELANPVCVIGTAIRDELFGGSGASGRRLCRLARRFSSTSSLSRASGCASVTKGSRSESCGRPRRGIPSPRRPGRTGCGDLAGAEAAGRS
jgi:putative ABC transport system permease protein